MILVERSSLGITDVGILYQIITSAEQSPDVESLPFRAIFTAYDRILAQNGLDPDHDQIYLRFLLRLGDTKVPRQSLYESFETLLAELGLQIEIHTGDDGDQQITTNLSANEGVGYHTSLQSNASDSPRNDRRRASFHSLYDADTENIRSQAMRPPSRALSSQYPFGKDARDRHRPTQTSIRPSGGVPRRPARSQSTTAETGRSRLTAQEHITNLQNHQRSQSSVTNTNISEIQNHVSDGGSLGDQADQIRLTSSERRASNGGGSGLIDGELSAGSQQHQTSYALARPELLYRPSETQLLRDADTFEHYRIKAVTREIFKQWSGAASQAERDHREMEIFAINHDTRILLQQGFDQWRAKLREKRRIAETERFFNRLEHRASRARDLFLLAKAFTHWAACASEEVLRTSRARRHILRLKYFNAWRDLTVVNELKVRRRGLQKFFDIWKYKCAQNLTDEASAVSHHYENLLKLTYWRWFWNFCEKRAPEWRITRLRAKYFRIWLDRHQQIAQREERVTITLQDGSKREIFLRWLQKSRKILSDGEEAVSFNYRRIAANSLNDWRLVRRHAPLAQQVSNMVDWRVAGNTFATFVARFRAERRAENVNRFRILRNMWTQWNDRLRCQALSQKIDDRFLLEALYKWVIAERARLLQRLVAQRAKQRTLSAISERLYANRAKRFQSLRMFQQSRDQQLQRSAMMRWRNRLELHREDERAALDFYHPRIARESVQVWNRRRVHLQMLDVWAVDSEYYFLGTKLLKRWQAAVVESRRKKRRDAYALVRRKLKMEIATKIIRRWRGLTATLTGLDQQAQAIHQDHLLRVGVTLFQSWRNRSEYVVDQSDKANDYFQQKLVLREVRTWRDKLRTQLELQERAQQFADIRTEKDAFRWLQKLRLQMIELQGRARNAESLRALHEKRHIHNLVRQWHSKTAARRGLPKRETGRSSRAKRFGVRIAAAEEDFTARVDEWTEIEDGFDDAPPPPPPPPLETEFNPALLPGSYLSTPSKRAGPQEVHVLPSSTTPAGTPLQRQRTAVGSLPKTPAAIFQRGPTAGGGGGGVITPFQRRLKIQQPKTEPRVITGRPSALSRSVAGAQFGAIDEEDKPVSLDGERL